jgi:hypothetical protein
VPTFAVNSLYDPANYDITLGLDCGRNLTTCNSSMLAEAQKYRDVMEDVFKSTVLARSSGNAVFGTACNQHEETCRALDYEGITIDGSSMQVAFFGWLQKQRVAWEARSTTGGTFSSVAGGPGAIFDVRWPGNPTCWVTSVSRAHGSC